MYTVNTRERHVDGLPAFKSIAEVPVRPEMVSVYLPPPVLLKTLPAIAEKGCDELWLNPGTESDEVLAEAEKLGLISSRIAESWVGCFPSGPVNVVSQK